MFRHYVFLTPTVFFQISILPYRKIKYRAFFSKYKVKYYWGRDPYNVDHILRRKELNRIGGKSLGQSTSFSMTSTIIWPQYRYVNFDQFYVYQTPIWERIYGHNWPSDMELVSCGSGWIKKEFFHQRFNPKKNNIAIFCALFAGEAEMVSFIRNVAGFFPDREILLQVRPNVLKTKTGSQFVERCLDGGREGF